MRFKNQNKKPLKPAPKHAAVECVQNKYVLWKKQWASWMGNRYNRLSFKSKIITLLCFVAIIGGYSIFLVASALKKKQSLNHSVSHISIPLHIKKRVNSPEANYAIQSKESRRIHRFRLYMDSLYKDPSGRLLYDSITRRRPGLMDSVYMVERNFSSRKYEKLSK